MKKQDTANFEDTIQVLMGASALSVPVIFFEVAWKRGQTLPAANIILWLN